MFPFCSSEQGCTVEFNVFTEWALSFTVLFSPLYRLVRSNEWYKVKPEMDFLCEYSVLQRRQKLFSVQECLPVDSKHTCLRDICWETESQYVCSKYIAISEIQGVLCFFFVCFLSAPTTQDQTPSSGVSVATPSVSVSTSAPSATPVQTVPQPVPQTLPPAVPHAVPQPTAAIPAFPPVMVPPFRVPLPGMPIPLPGKLANVNCLVRYMSMLSICLHSCVHCVWNLPESSPLRVFLKEFRHSRQTF